MRSRARFYLTCTAAGSIGGARVREDRRERCLEESRVFLGPNFRLVAASIATATDRKADRNAYVNASVQGIGV